MIVYDLLCDDGGHRFEGWFGSSGDFDSQQARGLVACPHCGCAHITKAVMAPRLSRKGNQQPERPAASVPLAVPQATAPEKPAPLSPEVQGTLRALARMQAEALKTSRWVGDAFADNARAMHYGDKAAEPIHGQTTPQQARALIDEGVEIAPVLFPVAPPEKIN